MLAHQAAQRTPQVARRHYCECREHEARRHGRYPRCPSREMVEVDGQQANMTTAEERLKVAIEVLGDHAWVRTWIAHQAVEKLLDALVEARVRDVYASPRNEVFDPPLFTPGPAAVYDQA